ncbi:MAG TPA: endolytic transglycosylase MltG [Chloroflexota bacterium]|nr:endolytic transglycosylase MltG [Chloroflexota bacterium]
MAEDQQMDRLRRLRAARGTGATRVEVYVPGKSGGQGGGPQYLTPKGGGGHAGAMVALLLILVIAIGVIGAGGYVLHQFHSSVGGPRREVRFVVLPGETVSSIATKLNQDGLVSSGFLFQLYYRFNGGAGNIEAGPHLLNTDMSMQQVADALRQTPPAPPPVDHSQDYNILPGHRAEEIATDLAAGGAVSYNDFMYQVRHGTFHYWFLTGLPPGAGVEGFLYPGLYHLHKHFDAHTLVNMMLANFGAHFTPAMHARAARRHLSVFDIVTMASIVQRESSIPVVEEYIAGTYYNRLANSAVVGNRLNADPTVQYALGYRPQEKTWWERNLSQTQTGSAISPYNTYLNPGLPPGPISEPGASSLHAALYPAPSQFLFFQAFGKDNKTHFCVTLDCQNNEAGVTVN